MDLLLLDNDRVIKLANLYTDESLGSLKKTLEGHINDTVYKVNKLETRCDEELDRLRRLKVGKEEVELIEQAIVQRIESEYLNELSEAKDYTNKKLETIMTKFAVF